MKFTAWYTLRKFVYNNLHNEDYETRLSRAINYFLIALIMSNAAAVLLESVHQYYVRYEAFFIILNFFQFLFLPQNTFYVFGQLQSQTVLNRLGKIV